MEFTDVIAPSFYECLEDIENHRYTHYWLKGGRGSTKSSFISLVMVLYLMRFPKRHAIVFRKIGDTLRDSVFSQLMWAIQRLGVEKYWHARISPMTLTYIPNGNKVVFRGVDDPLKIKSIKASDGYFAYLWFEELAEFNGMDEINNILQSTLRGGSDFYCFYSYNPPESNKNWVNAEAVQVRADRGVYHSTYLDVPKEWLGDAFITQAEHIKNVNESKYNHQYLGEVTGTGGEVFKNLTGRCITDEEIQRFDRVYRGLDWGYAVDPLAYVVTHYDATRKKLYIFHEFVKLNISNPKAAEHIKQENKNNELVRADSAEPKSIADLYDMNINIEGAKKRPGSVERGMRFLKDEVEEIIIDPARCPIAYQEFSSYEYEKDRYGQFVSRYPDKDNHTIDAVRYALENISDGNRFSW